MHRVTGEMFVKTAAIVDFVQDLDLFGCFFWEIQRVSGVLFGTTVFFLSFLGPERSLS